MNGKQRLKRAGVLKCRDLFRQRQFNACALNILRFC